jgi:hypothetical protein
MTSSGRHVPESKGEATIAFLPYASRREENGFGELSDVLDFKLATQYLGTALPISLKHAVVDAFRHSHSFLEHASNIDAMMQHWIAAASTLPYTDDVGESVVDTLLQMAFRDDLRSHIPVEAWNWLKKRPVLSPNCEGLKFGTSLEVFRAVREVGDLELIVSYLLVVWSKWSQSHPDGFTAVLEFIRSGLQGIEGAGYHGDLIQRLDDVLSQIKLESPAPPEAADNISWYTEFRRALEEVNKEARRMLTCTSHGVLACFYLLTYLCAYRISIYSHECASSFILVMYRPITSFSNSRMGFYNTGSLANLDYDVMFVFIGINTTDIFFITGRYFLFPSLILARQTVVPSPVGLPVVQSFNPALGVGSRVW